MSRMVQDQYVIYEEDDEDIFIEIGMVLQAFAEVLALLVRR
jgi:hypothetical protein